MTDTTRTCPVCGSLLLEAPARAADDVDAAYYDCVRCGRFGLTWQASQSVDAWKNQGSPVRKIATFAHALRRMQMGQQKPPMLTIDVVELVISQSALPTLQEQVDNLARWVGAKSSPGEAENISYLEHGAIIGAHSLEGFLFLIQGMINSGLLQGSLAGGDKASVSLTFSGWKRFEDLRRGAPSGRRAFMAMEYGDGRLDGIVDNFMRPAIADTGFDLRRLDDDPRAGLIDDRLRVEIRTARFILADLTHRNPGAYWEAGYAEGLGKPVIYTCEKCAFDKKTSHFDTNHHLHVLWEYDKLTDFVRRLKSTVRASIPEARGEDGQSEEGER